MYQGGSDSFLGPRDDIPLLDERFGLDLEAEIAVVTDDVPMGVDPLSARDHVKLVMLVNDVTLRGLVADELAKGFGFFQSKPSSAFSPVAVTLDELGPPGARPSCHCRCVPSLTASRWAAPMPALDMTFDFGVLIAHAARTRPLWPARSSGPAQCRTVRPTVAR